MSMMENKNCPLEEKAILFAYGELSGDEAAETAVHIGSCPHCSSTVNALRRAEEVLSSEKKLPSEAVVKYILNCREKEPERHTLNHRKGNVSGSAGNSFHRIGGKQYIRLFL